MHKKEVRLILCPSRKKAEYEFKKQCASHQNLPMQKDNIKKVLKNSFLIEYEDIVFEYRWVNLESDITKFFGLHYDTVDISHCIKFLNDAFKL